MDQTNAMLIGIFGLLLMALLGHISPNLDFSFRGARPLQESFTSSPAGQE